jgi:PadR family transcriptional regulator PadR
MGKDTQSALLPRTLELRILKTLTVGELHGYAIAQRVKTRSEEVLPGGESSLYPALQRILAIRRVLNAT